MSSRKKSKVEEKILNDIYDIVLDADTLEYERNMFLHYKNAIENGSYVLNCISQLLSELRPYAIKQELSPKVAKFYVESSSYKAIDKELGRGLTFWNGL
ncbi:bacteriocin immunity protein [Listeria sp. SHR_NRA_18]|uniref:bacteriocin immunity protein n=1 Tax=Listeria sp. SHR_NRA_18 TaxID=2269046 RepID=UPI00051E03CD|nr:bacteriocin immunity protein [Listeria sp. SHR_NRA_18]KGL42176.1 hypothetical protein EP56_10605 [Listeriaceae bacterium FSL A5-0209]RQW67695.1 bacteriocin immunity protein [Listeria sp. SHR_NRA_18]